MSLDALTLAPIRIEPDALYTPKMAAYASHRSYKHVVKMLRCGVIKGSRKSGRWLINGRELLKLA